ncbi:hypothetical protein PSHT_01870 [Puccinia striiformis]|uniref:Uncharacterized protein n=1 Tax=Puccinia striiformis TaxID=27350 RepID=A0A2S4WJJ1_9BASI|nr:hypothetical protein PSHT_01870 [Puccinia striiformis]
MENHREQGELVFQGFKRLASKCKPKNDRRSRSTGETVDVERVGPAEATIQLNRLQSDLLPLLQQRLTILSGLMKKSSLKGGQADSNLRSILVIQVEVEHNLGQIRAALYILCPEKPNDVVPNQTDDQHDEHVKFFKLHGLNKWLTMHLFPHLLLRFGESHYNNYTLQKAIEWINGSELDNLHERWSIGLLDINIHLRDLSRRRPPHNLQSDGAIVVADSLIPVMKLSRMFFSKLSRKGMNVKRLPMFTKMSSDQLEKLAKSASDLDTNSSKFRPIYMDENFMEEFPRDLFIKTANQLKNILEPALLSILIYYIPIIPNDDDDSLRSGLSTVQTRDYFYAWFVEWFVSFNLSIQNFIKTVESIQDE